MIKSIARSGITTTVTYRSMLAGNAAYFPLTGATYFPGESNSTQINKMPYTSETFSTLAATITTSANVVVTDFGSRAYGYTLLNGGGPINKFFFVADTNALFSAFTVSSLMSYLGGDVPDAYAIYLTNSTTNNTSHVVNKWTYATDSVTTSTSIQSVSGSVGLNPYTLSTDGTSMYFGGGSAAGSYFWGGVVQYFSNTDSASQVYADSNSRAKAYTAGANNGSTAGYIAGGYTMPYTTVNTAILKLTYATNIMTTITGTLTIGRVPVRTGMQKGVCAYYAGGKQSGSSVATSVTTVEKFVFATETSSNLASASVNRDGQASWNSITS